MNQISNPAILTVSFGTSHNTTREATIDAIERDIHAAFPAYPLYRAWTSKVIIAKLKQRDQVHIDTVEEALERMHSDGITDLIVQPTHIINGFENDAMKQAILSRSRSFRSISFGAPFSPARRITAGLWSSFPGNLTFRMMPQLWSSWGTAPDIMQTPSMPPWITGSRIWDIRIFLSEP